MKDSPRALVLDANTRHGLTTVRSLGRHGLRVTAGAESRLSTGGVSRYCDRQLQYPSPVTRKAAFVETIERELHKRDYDLLLPVAPSTVVPITQQKPRLETHTAIPYLPYEDLLAGLDKRQTIEAARDVDVLHPTTVVPEEIELDDVDDKLGYPVVVKPRRGSYRRGISVCDSPRELERVIEDTQEHHGSVLLQEYIPNGGEIGVYTVYDWETQLCGVTVQRRLRSNPPEGGSSTLREAISNPALIQIAGTLLSSLDWKGAAMVEFRFDARTGQPQLMEINPRLWGSLALTVHAGVDLPVLLYQLAVDGECESQTEYEVGARAYWLFGDLLQVSARDDRLTAVWELLQSMVSDCQYDICSMHDPLPAAVYGVHGIGGKVRQSILPG